MDLSWITAEDEWSLASRTSKENVLVLRNSADITCVAASRLLWTVLQDKMHDMPSLWR